jgi:hypothetical protein
VGVEVRGFEPLGFLRARSVLRLPPWNSVLLRTVNTREKRQVSGRRLAESAVMLLHGFWAGSPVATDAGCCPSAAHPWLSLGCARAAHLENGYGLHALCPEPETVEYRNDPPCEVPRLQFEDSMVESSCLASARWALAPASR